MSEEKNLKVLFVDDSAEDTDIVIRHLKTSGYNVTAERVYDTSTLEAALHNSLWDLVLCDYRLPSFEVGLVLDAMHQHKLDLPFIVVSGAVGEKLAVEVMKAGAHDFIVKGNLARLIPAIERERREAKVRAQRKIDLQKLAYLAAIVDSTAEAVIGQDFEGIITTWNTGAERLFGFTQTEAVGQSIYLITPKTEAANTAVLLKKLRDGEAVEHFESQRCRRDGTLVDVYLAISSIKNGEGELIGTATIASDITERKKVEEERNRMIEQLNETLSKVKTLNGLLPICASCKKIRDDKGYWQKLEIFVHEHSNAEFSHSMCPECMERMYPEYIQSRK